jgi:uncharacterized protein
MKRSFLLKLACPFDKHGLNIRIITQEQDEIMEGILTCTQCQRYYPIIHGIPIMSPDEYREPSLETPLLEKWGETVLAGHDKSVFVLVEENP